MKDLIARLVLLGDGAKMNAMLKSSEGRIRQFSTTARREFDSIKNSARSVEAKLGALGISFGGVVLMRQSAQLDKGLTQIGQTANESRINVLGLRKEFFRMAQETGQEVENLKQGFNNAVQSGLNFKEALPVTDAVNKAMAVTGANADQLTSGLTVAATAFRFDLSKPGMALALLDKMTVAGRQGNAELENLSSIFARVGVNASRAGMGFDQTLGFIEGLSLLERQPERLATLADSTLRLFTNYNYLAKAQKATGVQFFDKKGARRDPLQVLQDLKKKYDLLKTDKQRETFMARAFQGADLDTIKGLQALLSGNILQRISQMNQEVGKAPGKIAKDLPDAINNAVDQTGRLKAKLREAADEFIKPLNAGISEAIKKLIDPEKEGGLDLSGGQLMAGGTALLAGTYAAYRIGGPLAKKFLSKLGGTAGGIAMGKVVQAATGVTPVFVTNWPSGLAPGGNNGWTPGGGDGWGKLPTKTPLPKLKANLLKWLLAGGTGMTIAAALSALTAVGTAGYSAFDVLRGGSGKNWISDSPVWSGWYGNVLYDFFNKVENPEVKNNVSISLNVDGNRVVATSADMNTKIDLKRGRF